MFIMRFLSILIISNIHAKTLPKSETTAELSILDKVSSKNTNIKIQVGEEFFLVMLIQA